MNIETIVRLLKNSGVNVIGSDSSFVYIEDPSCILRGFETFIEYAWIIITAVTAVLLFGWAISIIRGAKNDIFINMRNLIIMFATLSVVTPIVDVIWGDKLFEIGCKQVAIPLDNLNTLLDMRNKKLKNASNDLYENLDIQDSGLVNTTRTQTVPPTHDADIPQTDANTRYNIDNFNVDEIQAPRDKTYVHAPVVVLPN